MHRNRSMFAVRFIVISILRFLSSWSLSMVECIVFTWDYHTSVSFWSGLRVQPIFTDEVQTFKALILVHKVVQEGHPVVSIRYQCFYELAELMHSHQTLKEAQGQSGWLETCGRTAGLESTRGQRINRWISLTLREIGQVTALWSKPTFNLSSPNFASIASDPNSMAYSNTKSISLSRALMIPMKGISIIFWNIKFVTDQVQVRDYIRFDGPTRPDRIVSKNHILTFQSKLE